MTEQVTLQRILIALLVGFLRGEISITSYEFFVNFILCTQIRDNYASHTGALTMCAEVSI